MKEPKKTIRIYLDRGDALCYQITEYAKRQHMDWQLIDYSDVVSDEDLWDEFQRLELKRFPVLQIDGKILRFQPASVDDLTRYLQQRQNLTMPV
jgi:hypothetical protein